MVAGLLLAAGRSSRFGADKLLATLGDHPVLWWSAATLGAAVDALYVVVPAGDGTRRRAISPLAHTLVENPRRDEGMASSLRAGIAALPSGVEAAVVALADQPLVSAGVVRALRDRWRAGDASAVAPRYRDGRGHPVLFGRDTFPALLSLEGDAGARAVLDALGERLALVDVEGTIPVDVDTPEHLRALEQAARRSRSRG